MFNPEDSGIHSLNNWDQDPVVRMPDGTSLGLNFNLGFFFLFIKSTLLNNFLYSF